METITIIIPVYNSGGLIRYAIESALKQDYKEIELIIVDDGSIDDTAMVILNTINLRDRVKVISNNTNQGLGNSLQLAFDNCKSRFAIILHHDDYLPTDYVSKIVNDLNDNTSLIFTRDIIVDSDGKKMPSNWLIQELKYSFPNAYIMLSSISTVGILVNVQVAQEHKLFKENTITIGESKEIIKTYDEWRTWVEFSKYGEVKYCRRTFAYYRQHKSNMRVQMDKIGDFKHRELEHNTRRIAKELFINKYTLFIYLLTLIVYLWPARIYSNIRKNL